MRAIRTLSTCAVVCVTLLAAPTARAQCSEDGGSGSVTNYGRLADPRVGYTSTTGKYIDRWCLERRNPKAVSADVVHPITVLIDQDVPEAWRVYIRRGVEEWQPAFDSIGFRNVFVVRVATGADSVKPPRHVVWVHKGGGGMSQVTGCSGNQIGELRSCEVTVNGEGYFDDAARAYCAQLIETDPALPAVCPDSFLGRYFQGAFAHEMGHALGLHHNFYAGAAYPTDSLRSAAFVHRWGHQPSVMSYVDYLPFVQPEDRIPLEDRWRRVGPYDRWAIAWGYRPIPTAKTAEEELPTLERWRSVQDSTPYLRYGGEVFLFSVYNQEMIGGTGGDNAITASQYRSQARARAWRRHFAADSANMLRSLTDSVRGTTYPTLWKDRFLRLLAFYVGGRVPQAPYPRDEAAVRYVPVPAARQLQVIRFVLGYALYRQEPTLQLLDTLVLSHEESDG